jgi:hypothetical protein
LSPLRPRLLRRLNRLPERRLASVRLSDLRRIVRPRDALSTKKIMRVTINLIAMRRRLIRKISLRSFRIGSSE